MGKGKKHEFLQHFFFFRKIKPVLKEKRK